MNQKLTNAQIQTRYKRKVREYIDTFKDVPCADCGKNFHRYAMDFDHVRGEKMFNISEICCTRMVSREKLNEEIRKCDVVCANCHRVRTFNRRNVDGVTKESPKAFRAEYKIKAARLPSISWHAIAHNNAVYGL